MILNRSFTGTPVNAGFTYIASVTDSIPDQFTFQNVLDATVNEEYSNTVAITGVDNGQILTVDNGEISNDQGVTWHSDSVPMVIGQTLVRATVTASSLNSRTVTVEVTVNTIVSEFRVTTRTAVSTPQQFTFADVTGAQLDTEYESIQPIIGVDPGATVTVSGSGGQVSNDGGNTWLLSVAMVVGSTLVKARVTSSENHTETRSITVSVNGISDTYSVRTKTAPVIIERTEDLAPQGLYMDELEAINLLLRSIGSTPVNSVASDQPDVANARSTINRNRNKGQQRGWWFNTDYGTKLIPDSAGGITIPNSISTLVCNNKNYVRRGNKLYDKVNNTFKFTAAVDVHRQVTILDWDDMPDCMREYCAYLAAAEFVRDEIEDPQKVSEFKELSMQSLFNVQKRDLEEGRYNMFTSSRVVQARSGVLPSYLSSDGY
jgi:hypothetical protein